jgi:hypothetical protein
VRRNAQVPHIFFVRSARVACAVVSVLAGTNNGLLQAEAAAYMGGLGQTARAAALDDARAFRKKHPARSSGARAAFDKLSEIGKFAVRILASITGGARRSHTHASPPSHMHAHARAICAGCAAV